jgi:eukaryotic-like serine/threonine-protein kinase
VGQTVTTSGKVHNVQAIKPTDLATAAGYVLTGILSENDLGTTYLGTNAEGRQVAVWVVRAHLFADAEAAQGFVRRMRRTTKVAGACTARVLAVGTENDHAYVVSRYVEGPTLDEAVRQGGPQSGAALTRLAASTATALAAIHRAWITHGDFKPANVILAAEGPLVAGYGIAGALGTTTEGMFGTPAYLSPEQISHSHAGSAADIFAWASTMVFAATGRPPFHGETWDETLRQVALGAPDLGSLDDQLRNVVAGCLAKDPAERPTAEQLLRTLPRPSLLQQQPLPAPPFPPAQRSLHGQPSPPQPPPAGTPSPPPAGAMPAQPQTAAQPQTSAQPQISAQPQTGAQPQTSPPAQPEAGLAARHPADAPGQTPGPPPQSPAPPALLSAAPVASSAAPVDPPSVPLVSFTAPLTPVQVPPRERAHSGGGKGFGVMVSEAWERGKMWVPVAAIAMVAIVTAVVLVLTASPGQSHAPAAETRTQPGTNPAQQATGSRASGHASASPQKSPVQAPTPTAATSASSTPKPKRKPVPAGTPQPAGPDLAVNGSFDTGQLAPWMDTGNSVVTNLQAKTGSYSAAMHSTGTGAGVAQDLTGLTPGTTYQLTGWVMSGEIAGNVFLGVRDYNEAMSTSRASASTSWTFESMTFTPMTDTAQIWCSRLAGGYGYCDNVSVRAMQK